MRAKMRSEPMDLPSTTPLNETAMAILQATDQGRLGITVLNKALFYADLAALRDLGKTLTGSGYVAIPNGPVVNHYERAVVRDLGSIGRKKPIHPSRFRQQRMGASSLLRGPVDSGQHRDRIAARRFVRMMLLEFKLSALRSSTFRPTSAGYN